MIEVPDEGGSRLQYPQSERHDRPGPYSKAEVLEFLATQMLPYRISLITQGLPIPPGPEAQIFFQEQLEIAKGIKENGGISDTHIARVEQYIETMADKDWNSSTKLNQLLSYVQTQLSQRPQS